MQCVMISDFFQSDISVSSASVFKLNKIFFGYFDPEKIFLDDENK